MKLQFILAALTASSSVSALILTEYIEGCPALPPAAKTSSSSSSTISSEAFSVTTTSTEPLTTSSAIPSSSSSSEAFSVTMTSAEPLTTSSAVSSSSSEAPVLSTSSEEVPPPMTSTSTIMAIPTPAPAPTTLSTVTVTSSTSAEETSATSTVAASVAAPTSAAVSGVSTFYGGNLSGGACSFGTLPAIPNGMFGTAFSGAIWDNAAECGACLKVTGPKGNSVTVMVVDECPECEVGHLDLFQDAFAQLDDISLGRIATSYVVVDCGLTTPITLHSKSGTSAYYFALQVVGANEATSTLEVSVDGGAWQKTVRQTYNFFETGSTTGFGSGTYSVRITSVSGKQVVVDNVQISSDAQTVAQGNY